MQLTTTAMRHAATQMQIDAMWFELLCVHRLRPAATSAMRPAATCEGFECGLPQISAMRPAATLTRNLKHNMHYKKLYTDASPPDD